MELGATDDNGRPADIAQVRMQLEELVTHLRETVLKVDDPRGQALLETSAEVVGGLATAFTDYDRRNEPAWQPNDSAR